MSAVGFGSSVGLVSSPTERDAIVADWDGSLSLESAVVLPASRPLIHCHGREWTLAASPTPQVPTRHGGNALAESFAPSSKFFKFLFFFFFKHKPYPLP